MLSFTDQLGNDVVLVRAPRRIISLVPSQTELLFNLGLDDEVIGITKFCIHPDHWFQNKVRIGGTKTVDIEKVKALQPDLIIANKEENVQEQIEVLQLVAPVWLSDVNTLDDALNMINSIGQLTKKETEAKALVSKILSSFNQLSSHQPSTTNHQPSSHQPSTTNSQRLNTAYLIWQNPYMTVGGDTFIGDMIRRCGLQNVFECQKRYPIVTLQDLIDHNCKLLLLSTEPFPFTQKYIDALQKQLPAVTILLVDGEMFSWYGSRLLPAAGYLRQLKSKIDAFTLR